MLTLLIKRELLTSWHEPHQLVQPVLFFAFTIALFPIALGSDEQSLRTTAPAAIWLALVLATLLAGERLFTEDHDDGSLSQNRIHLCSHFWLLPLAKLISAWLYFTLPLILCLPLFMVMLHIPVSALPAHALLIVLGSLALLLIAMLGAALTLSQQQGTFLLFLITLPFYVPVLIIGVTATTSLSNNLPYQGHLALLAAYALFMTLVTIPLTSLTLKAQPSP